MENAIECPNEEPEKLTVGKEFTAWAERYWGLKRKYEVAEQGGESCPYDFVREAFVNKINEIVKERLSL